MLVAWDQRRSDKKITAAHKSYAIHKTEGAAHIQLHSRKSLYSSMPVGGQDYVIV